MCLHPSCNNCLTLGCCVYEVMRPRSEAGLFHAKVFRECFDASCLSCTGHENTIPQCSLRFNVLQSVCCMR
jgi:hypothetical protein